MKSLVTAAGLGAFCSVLLLAGAGAAETGHKIHIMTVDDAGLEPVVFHFSTDQNLSDLQDGESRVVAGEDGETVTVSRNGDELNITTASGEVVTMPFMHGEEMHLEHESNHSAHNQAGHKNVRVIRKHKGEPARDIMIMSPGGLSEHEKQVLRDAMVAAGIDKELHFVGDAFDGEINIEIDTSD
jgi:hypothetical protein